ncbi:MAG: xanthine dehydrogenase [Alphaproteobacteria bacterium]|nr:xanthine dehydrogenase [Alphaproteobacteria bacterium]
MKRETLLALNAARRAGRAVVLASDMTTAAARLITAGDKDDPLAEDAREALRLDKARIVEKDGAATMLTPYNPPLELLIVGAVHIAQPLSRMAALAGFRVTIIDPRTAFATEERFPGLTLLTAWPDEALKTRAINHRTAFVALTHDPKLDDPALAVALRSEAFYIGALGSKKTHAKRLDRLTAHGFDATTLARIKGPIGLAIGAVTPAEIAVSILAQMIAVLRRAEG